MVQGVDQNVREVVRFKHVKVDPFVREFDMGLAQPLSRSIRLNGLATCLRLEQIYWDILAEIARINCCSISALLSHVDREVHLRHGGVKNFSGLVRVVCVAHSLKEGACQITEASAGGRA